MTVFNAFFKVAKKYIGNFIMYTCIFLGVTYAMTNMQEKNPIESYSATECKVAIFNHSDDALAGYLVDYVDEHHDIVDIDEDNLVIVIAEEGVGIITIDKVERLTIVDNIL